MNTHTHMHTHTYVHPHMHLHTHIHTCTHICTHNTHMCTHIHTCTCEHTYAHTIHTRAKTCMCTHIHTCTCEHTYAHILQPALQPNNHSMWTLLLSYLPLSLIWLLPFVSCVQVPSGRGKRNKPRSRAFPPSSFWSLAVCKNGGGKAWSILSCEWHQCLPR